jgi:hypothetical protein
MNRLMALEGRRLRLRGGGIPIDPAALRSTNK